MTILRQRCLSKNADVLDLLSVCPEIQKRLECADEEAGKHGQTIVFSDQISDSRHGPNANAGIPGRIVVNPEWIRRLIINDDPDTVLAYRLTIGHELTHKEPEPGIFSLAKNGTHFITWCREVHADFGGAEKMCDSSKTKLIRGLEYKKKLSKTSNNTFCHPSWNMRIQYANTGCFDDVLIAQIAEDACCRDEKLIRKMQKWFDPIQLRE